MIVSIVLNYGNACPSKVLVESFIVPFSRYTRLLLRVSVSIVYILNGLTSTVACVRGVSCPLSFSIFILKMILLCI